MKENNLQRRRYALHANMRRYGYRITVRHKTVLIPFLLINNPPRPLVSKWMSELSKFGYEFQTAIE